MSLPYSIQLEAGGAACVTVIGSKVLLVVPRAGAVLTRAECEHLGDALYAVGAIAEPKRLVVTGRAKPITSVSDPRVGGETECPDVPRAGDSITSAPQG